MERRLRVLVTDELSSRGLDVLRQHSGIHVDSRPQTSREELLQMIDQYDALIVRSATKVPAEVIRTGKQLKVIGRAGVGVD
ncbi:MAG: phosphoglycerate dehydrogenase, partial [Candidatus Methylomirabilales bacterium]